MSQYKEYGYQSAVGCCAHRYILPILIRQLRDCGARSVLDIGCGNGSLSVELIKAGFDVYGIDASQEGMDIARSNYPERFFLHDVTQHRLPDALNEIIFDTVVSIEVIEHLYDPHDFITFCASILDKSMSARNLIITTPYHGYLKNLAIAFLDQYDNHHLPLWDGGHIKFWSKSTLTQLLEQGGFKVRSFTGAGRVPYLWKSMILFATKT